MKYVFPEDSFHKRLFEILKKDIKGVPLDPRKIAIYWEEKLGITQSAIRDSWANKQAFPKADIIIRLCELTGCSADWLFIGIDINKNKEGENFIKHLYYKEKYLNAGEENLKLKKENNELKDKIQELEKIIENITKHLQPGGRREIDKFAVNPS